MIDIKIKRVKGNEFVTFGILYIPQFDFRCHTMELREPSDKARAFFSCSLPLGQYPLMQCFKNGLYGWPQLKKRMKGFVHRSIFDAWNTEYTTLSTGDIAIGLPKNNISLKPSEELRKTFNNIMIEIFNNSKYVNLEIFKTNRFEYERIGDNSVKFIAERTDWLDDEENEDEPSLFK